MITAGQKLTAIQKRISKGGSICSPCAKKHGGTWPEGHVATFCESKCDFCGETDATCDTTDWDFPWRRLKALEREF